ncbi:hypothetical protein, partial [Ligilactobacillus acidipiscis]|uniref:hypothetical protein n=1 Tax=Ligilactobacillus acidipiscis TaxID=89059 RepID=UPI000A5B0044
FLYKNSADERSSTPKSLDPFFYCLFLKFYSSYGIFVVISSEFNKIYLAIVIQGGSLNDSESC